MTGRRTFGDQQETGSEATEAEAAQRGRTLSYPTRTFIRLGTENKSWPAPLGLLFSLELAVPLCRLSFGRWKSKFLSVSVSVVSPISRTDRANLCSFVRASHLPFDAEVGASCAPIGPTVSYIGESHLGADAQPPNRVGSSIGRKLNSLDAAVETPQQHNISVFAWGMATSWATNLER